MSLPRIKWSFLLLDFSKNIQHTTISEELNLLPSKIWNIEDYPLLPIEMRCSGWGYSIEDNGVKSVDRVFLSLKQILLPRLEEIELLIKRYGLRVQLLCVIEAISGDGPEVSLGIESIKFISELGGDLSFDLYYGEE